MEIIRYVVKRLETLEDVGECAVPKENLFPPVLSLLLSLFLFMEKASKAVTSYTTKPNIATSLNTKYTENRKVLKRNPL